MKSFWAMQRLLGWMFGISWYKKSYIGLMIFVQMNLFYAWAEDWASGLVWLAVCFLTVRVFGLFIVTMPPPILGEPRNKFIQLWYFSSSYTVIYASLIEWLFLLHLFFTRLLHLWLLYFVFYSNKVNMLVCKVIYKLYYIDCGIVYCYNECHWLILVDANVV